MPYANDSFEPIRQSLDIKPDTVDSEGAAEILKIHVETVEERARKGEIPGAIIGRKWVFIRIQLLEWLSEQIKNQTEARAGITKAPHEVKHPQSTLKAIRHTRGKRNTTPPPLPELRR